MNITQINLEGFTPIMYPLCGIVGWLSAYIYITSNIQERYLKRKVHKILEIAIVIAIIGARLFWVITTMCIERRLFSIYDFVNGGLVYYGGMLTVVSLIYTLFPYLEIGKYQDVFIIAIPLFHGFARIGCYFAGCCYGKWNIPIQLIESICCFGIFLFLHRCKNNLKYKGKLIFVYLTLYAIIRFLLEFLRGDISRGIWFGLSTSQYISIIILVIFCIKNTNERKNRKWKILWMQ